MGNSASAGMGSKSNPAFSSPEMLRVIGNLKADDMIKKAKLRQSGCKKNEPCSPKCSFCEECDQVLCAQCVSTRKLDFDSEWKILVAEMKLFNDSDNKTPHTRKCSNCESIYCFDCNGNAYCSAPSCDATVCPDCEYTMTFCCDCFKHFCNSCADFQECQECYQWRCGCQPDCSCCK